MPLVVQLHASFTHTVYMYICYKVGWRAESLFNIVKACSLHLVRTLPFSAVKVVTSGIAKRNPVRATRASLLQYTQAGEAGESTTIYVDEFHQLPCNTLHTKILVNNKI